MRIKFKKGLSPEAIANMFLRIVEERDLVIGSVNIYIQEYGEDMKPIPYNQNDEYLEVTPSVSSKQKYEDYAADLRRSKLKVI